MKKACVACGKIPSLALAALCVSLGAERLAPPRLPEPVAADARPMDFELIDRVLAERAPGMGLTLRQEVAVAIAEEAQRAHFDPLLILAIIKVESDFDERALSPKGARGLMQVMPSTLYFLAEREGLRLSREEVASDPALCARLAIRYLRTLNDQFGKLDLALMAYNAGPAKIRTLLGRRQVDHLRQYPLWVRRHYREFREGIGLGGDWALALR